MNLDAVTFFQRLPNLFLFSDGWDANRPNRELLSLPLSLHLHLPLPLHLHLPVKRQRRALYQHGVQPHEG